MDDKEFCNLIENYDVIFLLETWTNQDSIVDFDGYKSHNFYRKFQHKKARRCSGGIVLYCRESIAKDITVVRNHFDTIIWIKIDKDFFRIESDIFICATYIWGQDSPAYNVVNSNLFEIIESDIHYYQTLGTVLIAGDMNSRVGRKADYILYDRINSVMDRQDMFRTFQSNGRQWTLIITLTVSSF